MSDKAKIEEAKREAPADVAANKILQLVDGLKLVCGEHGASCDPRLTSDELKTLATEYLEQRRLIRHGLSSIAPRQKKRGRENSTPSEDRDLLASSTVSQSEAVATLDKTAEGGHDAGYAAATRWQSIETVEDLPVFESDRDCWFAYRDTGEPATVFWRHNWSDERKQEIVLKYSAWVAAFTPAPFTEGETK